jgi:hypothetical protein
MDPDDDLLAWLLSGDPAVRWQVHHDLLDASADTVAGERARVASEGWGARLLAEQAPDGTWGGGLYSPKWTSTTYTLLLLRQLGLGSGNPQAQAGCGQLLDGARWFGGGLTYGRAQREPETCITAIVTSIVSAFGVVDTRIVEAVDWLLGQQLDDGGWNCETVRCGSMHGSFHTSILVLEALREWQRAQRTDDAVTRAATRGRAFFLEHRLYCSHRTGLPVDPSFMRMVFPPGWRHDVLRGLDHFQSVGAPADDRLADSIELLRSRRRADRTWPAYRPPPGRHWFELEAARRPSRINTLRALRVLRWWDSSGRRGS